MKEETRIQRLRKTSSCANAAIDHLKRAIAALDDANLYASESQEEIIDNAVSKIMVVIERITENNIIMQPKTVSFEELFSDRKKP